MYQDTYYIAKRTGTLTDALLAYGVAMVLQDVLIAAHIPKRFTVVRINDQGAHFEISLHRPIQEEWLKHPLSHDLALAVKGKKALADHVPFIDYNLIWDEIRMEQELRAVRRTARTSQETVVQDLEESAKTQPHRDVALLLGDYRMQVAGIHNQAVLQWCEMMQRDDYRFATLQALLRLFACPWPDIESVEKEWALAVKVKGINQQLSVSQVYNPSRGKGLIRTGGDKLLQENFKSFWLLEYLKAVGLFIAAAPRAFTDEKMRKTYVLSPLHITLQVHRDIFTSHFESVFYGLGVSPIKSDILASLQYASAYLSYYLDSNRQEDTLVPNPTTGIAGFYVASYVLLSKNSYTMINLSFLGLPPWLHAIDTEDDVIAVQEVIKEHEQFIRPLQEEFQEGNDLLNAYRTFLASRQVDAFFDFCAGYGEYVVRTLRSTTRIKQCSVPSLDELVRRIPMREQDGLGAGLETSTRRKDDLTEFRFASGAHPGFHNIAYAIRQSTVVPQRQLAEFKANQRNEKPLYTVRYGLGNQLRRKATSASELMDALSEILHEYNAETSQVFENTSDERRSDGENYARTHYRQRVFLEDLDDVLDLINLYGSRLVCNLLVAYGYASVGRKKDQGGKTSTNDVSSPESASNGEREETPL